MPLFRWLMTSAGGIITPTDPYFANVIGLMHFDALPVIDSSSYGYTYTGNTTQSLTASSPIYGAKSWNGPGAGSVLQAPSAGDSNYNIGTNDFTMEFAFKSSSTSTKYLVGFFSGIGTNIQLSINASGVPLDVLLYAPTGAYGCTSGVNYNDGNTHYLAVSRTSGSLRFFVDGTNYGGAQTATAAFDFRRLTLGCTSTKGSQITMMDEFRLTRGVGRYPVASYSVQTEPFPDA